MKIVHSRQTCAERTDRHTDKVTYWAPVGAKNINQAKNILNNSFLFYSLAPMFEVLLVFKAQLISRPLSATQCCHTAGLGWWHSLMWHWPPGPPTVTPTVPHTYNVLHNITTKSNHKQWLHLKVESLDMSFPLTVFAVGGFHLANN